MNRERIAAENKPNRASGDVPTFDRGEFVIKPVVLITGASGNMGSAVARELADEFTVVGLDQITEGAPCECIRVDLTSADSIELALGKIREKHGSKIASVIHLAAYFDFTGEDHPLYQKLNVEGTRLLLRGLRDFEVEQFVYSGTMLVHRPCEPGEHIDETAPIRPGWAYPFSKAEAEKVIAGERGDIPAVCLHLAGLYDDRSAVPTLAEQIARIYERDLKAHLYAGDLRAAQSLIHVEDLTDLIRRVVERRVDLADEVTILAGEPDPPSYAWLQDAIGEEIHGAEEWTTIRVPQPVAKLGAWLELKAEPVIPDSLDKGEKPFVRPFMVAMAEDHYALDIDRARRLLEWEPRHDIRAVLPKIVAALKEYPAAWYTANGIVQPDFLDAMESRREKPEKVRADHERAYRQAHRANIWGHFGNIGLAGWLLTSPPLLGYQSAALVWSDLISGAALCFAALLSLSWRLSMARWLCAAIGLWLLFAPLIFWAPTAAAYLNDTLVGALVIGFSVLVRPTPGVSPAAARTGPAVPPGWEFSPSSWLQRLPIILLALVGLQISRYLAAYQLGHIDSVWEPFFSGGPDPKNGTEEIITSSVSEAWPVPDAGIGAVTYMLEILTGLIGGTRRWRTMPWLVVLFGIMIVPLGVVSITFIVIQPIVIGTWCTLCLVGAAAMLLQIPYSLDELVATGQFLQRRRKAGRPWLLVFFTGDTDEGATKGLEDEFERHPMVLAREVLGGGVGAPWNLAVSAAIGVWLMFTRATVGAEGAAANADHLVGALVLTVTVTAFAEVARAARFVNIAFGTALLILPLILEMGLAAMVSDFVCGGLLIALSIRRGKICNSYGTWNRYIV